MAAGAVPLVRAVRKSKEKERIPYCCWWTYIPVILASVAVAIIAVALGNADTKSTTTSCWSTSYDARLGIGQDRCTIDRVPEQEMTPERFASNYWRKKPVILLRDSKAVNVRAQQFTSPNSLVLQRHQAHSLPLAGSESYAFRGEQRINLQDYLLVSANEQENQAANATSFSFGTDVMMGVGEQYHIKETISND